MLPKTKQPRTDMSDADFKASVAEHVRDVVALLSGKVSLENLNAQTLTFTANGSDEAVRVKTRFQSKPVLVLPGEIVNLSDADVPGVYAPAWRFVDGDLYLYNFATLAAGIDYRINLVVLGGG